MPVGEETPSPADRIALQRLAKKIESLDEEFKKQHFVIVELLGQEDDLTQEQAKLDEHDDQVAALSDLVEQLRLLGSESTIELTLTASRPSELGKRLKYMEDKLGSVTEEMRPLVPGPKLDSCLVHQLHKRVDMAPNEVMGISREIIALDKGGEDLLVPATKPERTALDLGLPIERLSYRQGSI